jgi:2-polyprenyl-6-methoxyphenol hydroxylase-like FAD-dependent oxidoreductase
MQAFDCLQVWDSCSDSMIAFSQDDMTEPLAYIVENDVILGAIMKQVKQAHKGFCCFCLTV